MKLLYLSRMAEGDSLTAERLSRISPQLAITTVATAGEAMREIQRSGGFHALLTSPSIAHAETLAIIGSLRDRQVPIAIVPVVTEAQQDFLATAIAGGADDVLVLSGESVMQPTEALTRIRQSPHLFPNDGRLRVLYAGSDPSIWRLLEHIPFVRPERATCAPDGGCAVRVPASPDGHLRCDVVLIDERPDEAHPLQVVKSVKAQASDLPVIVLSPPGGEDMSTAAFNLGADDAVVKSGAFGYRLVATLRRVYQRLELASQNVTLKDRESRLRRIVETMPDGLAELSADGTVLAINGAALNLVGASRPREVVGRDLCMLVVSHQRAEVRGVLERVAAGEPGSVEFELEGMDEAWHRIELRGVPLEKDSRGSRGVIAALRAAGDDPAPDADDSGAKAAISVDAGSRRTGRGRR
jgi:PAS domain S-box-containing protein